MATDEWVEVYRTGEDLQMEFVKGLLTTNGIPVVVQRKGAKELGFFLGATAFGDLIIKVPPDRAEFALELLGAPLADEESEGENENDK